MAFGSPMLCEGCLFLAASVLSGEESDGAAKLVSVSDGAMALTLTLGAHSAARDLTKPSTAPLAAAMEAWKGMPVFAATELKSTTEGELLFFKAL